MLRTRKFWCFAAVAAAVALAASHAEAGWRHRGGSWGSSGGSWGSSGGSWGSSGGGWGSSGGSYGSSGGGWGCSGGSWGSYGSYGGYNRGSWGYSASWVGGSWGSRGGYNYGHAAYQGPGHNGWKVVDPDDAQTKPPTRTNGNENGKATTPPPPPADGGTEPPMTDGATPMPPATQPAIPPTPGDTDIPGFDTTPPPTTPGDTTPPANGGVLDPFGARQVSTSALIAVDVPEQATVTINGRPTTSKGEERQYISRGLKPGYAYQYDIAVDLGDLNANQILTRTVRLRAGEKVILKFEYEEMEGEDEQAYNEPMGDEATDTTMSLVVPADAKVYLAGRATTSTGTYREYKTSKLVPGQSWDDYTIRVTVERDGQTVAKEKTINLVAGKHVDLTFDFDAPQVAKAAH